MKDFHHALKIVDDLCIGCSKCMNVCPTAAIRVRRGKARLMDNRCIDCGECYRICPVSAIIIEQDDLNKIFAFKYRVALVPAVFFGQFKSKYSINKIYSLLYEMGFTHILEVEHGVQIIKEEVKQILKSNTEFKPLISAFCPAIVRLIQVKFPALVHHFILLKTPLDVAAEYIRLRMKNEGYPEGETGIFYFTQCAAKIAAIKSPADEEESQIDGVINMDSVFNKIYQKLQCDDTGDTCTVPMVEPLAPEGVLWSLTTGESDHAMGRRMAIDGVHNVINFLEKLEQQDQPDFDFLELRACDESCAGGVLTTENRFLTAERMRKRARVIREQPAKQAPAEIVKYKESLLPRITLGEIKPRSMMKLD
ncbi:MAG: [Fe-Fe] hydrogenase large subunit C-terminal domain-containing protein, partial [Bacteroidales bacterium]